MGPECKMSGTVAIAISAFRSDGAVINLIESIFAKPHPEVGTVIVVDSLGSGRISDVALQRGWKVRYENSVTNLGSAGNLSRRVALAAESGATWCLCLNHDASWDAQRLSEMLAVAVSRPRVGAVYPILDHSPREPRWEEGRKHFLPTSGGRVAELPGWDAASEVLWSSSNSALYALRPHAEGVSFFTDLWHGYEDLAYGIALNRAGWVQLSCRAAKLSQIFDYTPARFLWLVRHIPSKPEWYSYYNLRNLILIRRKYGAEFMPFKVIFKKLLQSTARILFLENRKWKRIKFLYSGLIAGMRGESGKGVYP